MTNFTAKQQIACTFLLLFSLLCFHRTQAQWVLKSNGFGIGLHAVNMRTNTFGLAVGDNGQILRTTDGGNIWVPYPSGATTLYDVEHLGLNEAIAVGAGGTILKSNDGGMTWTPRVSGTTQQLNAVHFPALLTGYAVGNNGTILFSSDVGNTWTPLSSGTINDLNDVHVFTGNITLAVGDGGTIVKTNNGGGIWNTIASGTTEDLTHIQLDPWDVYVSGTNNTLLKSINAGNAFNPMGSPSVGDVLSLHFKNDDVGYVVGTGGAQLTCDGGATWYDMCATWSPFGFGTDIFFTFGGRAFMTTAGGQLYCNDFPAATVDFDVPNLGNLCKFTVYTFSNLSVNPIESTWTLERFVGGNWVVVATSTATDYLKSFLVDDPYRLTLEIVDDCGRKGSVTKNFNVNPTINITTSIAPTCTGGDVTVSQNSVGSNFTYEFSDGTVVNTSASTITQSFVPGNYTVTVTDEFGCDATANFVVNPYGLTVTCSANLLGASGNIGFNANASGGAPPYNYSWTGQVDGTSFASGNSNYVFTSGTPPYGCYEGAVTVTDANGCTATCAAGVPCAPLTIQTCQALYQVIKANYPNGNVSFQATVTGGLPPYTYQWDVARQTDNTGTVTQGLYFTASTPFLPYVNDLAGGNLIVTDAAGTVVTCQAGFFPCTDGRTVTCNVVADAGNPFQYNYSANVTGGTGPFLFYWYDQNLSFLPQGTGNTMSYVFGSPPPLSCYSFTVVAYDVTDDCWIGCTFNDPDLACKTGQQTAVENDLSITVYPNPFRDHFTLEWSGMEPGSKATVYDAAGRVVKQVELSDANGKALLDLDAAASGLYMIRVLREGSAVWERKLIRF